MKVLGYELYLIPCEYL